MANLYPQMEMQALYFGLPKNEIREQHKIKVTRSITLKEKCKNNTISLGYFSTK